jgi:uncharacterized repeat protein (TIGR01451 family)
MQVVSFTVPSGVNVEILGPAPEMLPSPPGAPLNYGLKVGVGYRLRVSELPNRPGSELFPVIEIVGHLHRPPGIDPLKFPIRIVFGEDDFVDAFDRRRLVTQAIYLEDPEQAMPIALPKGEIPVVTLNPAEDPLKVGEALGRVMAIVRNGARRPMPEDLNGPCDVGDVPGFNPSIHCPFSGPGGNPCALPCGPVRGTPPPTGKPWAPRDEYLCDGGDHAEPVHFGGDGGLRGIDPRDAVVEFDDTRRPRILPTNRVCVYAPRFASVRVSIGPNEALIVQKPNGAETIAAGAEFDTRQGPRRFVQNLAAQADRGHIRASAMRGRVYPGDHSELRVLNGYSTVIHPAGHVRVENPVTMKTRQKPGGLDQRARLVAIKTAESAVVTGIVEGASQMVMTWTPHEAVGVELPPKHPGLAVIKRVSAAEAEQGDELTYVIQYRNMGNLPIRAVSIVDSLLPRLGYVPGSAQGPKGTVFSAGENRAGSTELRWDLPGVLAPGKEGSVSFRVIVR